MILPTKGISPQRALLSVGSQVLEVLQRSSLTITQTWARLLELRERQGTRAPLTFEWFVFSLDVLFALDLIQVEGDLLTARASNAPTS